MTPESLPALIAALSNRNSPLLPLPESEQEPIRVISTHISWILLTRHYAYKIKKSVNFGFVDFTTLEKRRFFCQEELRLNRRFAADLYLETVAIHGSPDAPTLETTGHPIEYAVKLKRFEQSEIGLELAGKGLLTCELMEKLASTLAVFHNQAQRAENNSDYGSVATIRAYSEHNFSLLDSLCHPAVDAICAPIRQFEQQEFARIESVLETRKNHGFIRECHGDLHLNNLVRLGGQLIPFDCIEFNESLRWIDVINDIAFLCMDMEAHAQHAALFQTLNRYLELSGDYAGMAVFRYYCVYRAMVRAKIAHLNDPGAAPDKEVNSNLYRYLASAARFSTPDRPTLFITHGFSGSGKSWLARRMAPELAAIRINSDIERKRLHGYAALDNTKRAAGDGIYTHDATERTYTHLHDTTALLLRAGYNTIVDATFLLKRHRRQFAQLADEVGVEFKILDVDEPYEVIESRIKMRMKRNDEPSEADLSILALQKQYAEALDESEKLYIHDKKTTGQAAF
ncbi:AAA family ATPase [Candidatus Methylospira mobilis]|uniref:AAA family ATPase n=1 Tax=Candidatus Methylospira mobilis TaxID=1808979 RepID=A0A5Q0BJD2_9GAMM|nr:bifunctional aminoglycoside phosphotransferase/ATP-binding protein [Candidatus Methylospira mobilis]QFY43669.1 AAA family ATPase [Candidatus Methylospira mobilis]WNV04657.1 AAA family ATPase [Candidatus Methylospira mobilis]